MTRRTWRQFERRWSRDSKPGRCRCRKAAARCWLENSNHNRAYPGAKTDHQVLKCRIFFCKQKLHNMLDNLVHILRNSTCLTLQILRDICKVMTTLFLYMLLIIFADWLPLKCCYGVFSDLFLFKCIWSCETLDPNAAVSFVGM